MRKLILIMSIASFFGLASAREFSEGQIWSYKTRNGEQGSTLLVNKVEADPKLGSIYHISLSGVRVKNPRAPSGVSSELPHFPVSKETLEQSCIKLVGCSKPNPQYLDGYAEWKGAFDQGRAGIFTISAAEIVDVVEAAVNK